MNIIEGLLEDHQKLKRVMDKLRIIIEKESEESDSDSKKKEKLFQEFKKLFDVHDKIEDDILYPALKEVSEMRQDTLKAYQEHHMAEVGILELRVTPYASETWGPKFLVIRESIMNHIKEEETSMFPNAEKHLSKTKLEKLGREMAKVKEKEGETY